MNDFNGNATTLNSDCKSNGNRIFSRSWLRYNNRIEWECTRGNIYIDSKLHNQGHIARVQVRHNFDFAYTLPLPLPLPLASSWHSASSIKHRDNVTCTLVIILKRQQDNFCRVYLITCHRSLWRVQLCAFLTSMPEGSELSISRSADWPLMKELQLLHIGTVSPIRLRLTKLRPNGYRFWTVKWAYR
jgi:hypothetical protein